MAGKEGKDFGPLRDNSGSSGDSGRSPARGRELAQHFWSEVRGGAEHFQSWRGQLPRGRLRQFVHGLSLPFHIARAVLKDADARRRYLRTGIAQLVVALALAVMFVGSARKVKDEARDDDAKERGRRQAAAVMDPARQERIEQKARELSAALAAAEARAQGLEPSGRDGGTGEAPPVARSIAALATELALVVAQEASGADGGVSVRASLGDEGEEAEEDAEDEEDAASEEAPAEREARAPADTGRPEWLEELLALGNFAYWAALFAMLNIVQWGVIALSRDYHTLTARDASLLTGVPPEDDDFTPRVRLNMPWLRAKLRRRWRSFIIFVVGLPAVALLTLPVLCVPQSFTVLSTAWGLWWLTVFTAAKSARAWDDTTPPTPWFLRGWEWLTTHVPGLGWGFARRYGARWTRASREVFAPAACVERLPWAFAGLALVRLVGSLPPFKFFVRPLIPVASAHLLLAERATREGPEEGSPALPPPAPPTGSLD